jgi:ferredoxin-type protein NapH
VTLQTRRRGFQAGFFALFLLAPPLDLLRLDLTLGHFILLGQDWTLGLEAFQRGAAGTAEMAWNLFWRAFLPIALVVGGGVYAAWRWGRLYCGWLCPHFSVVEALNGLMRRASGRPSLWERQPLPRRQPDGRMEVPDRRWWPLVWLAALGLAFLWALTLLTYLLPPFEIYHNLLHGTLTPNQLRFLGVATAILFLEFTLARHLFCRFGCAIGLFQSLAWMANDQALVVGFDTRRARECGACNNACDNLCPMRLKPRTLKRKMFTCTECAQCIRACDQVMAGNPQGGLLRWVQGAAARPVVSGRPQGRMTAVLTRPAGKS